MKSVASIQARLLNIAKERGVQFQDLLNLLGAEQLLYRLSISEFSDKFVFKGGSLLTYLIDSERKTRDLDFSVKGLSNQVDEIVKIMQRVTSIRVEDGFVWNKVSGEPLNHPEMAAPGVRLRNPFLFGKMKGMVHMDMAFSDAVEAIKQPLSRMQYRDEPFFEEELSLMIYPLETIFSEKYCIAQTKGGQNTRMKDYYDLFKLCGHDFDSQKLKNSIKLTFDNRKVDVARKLRFDPQELDRLEIYWGHFLKREQLADAPTSIGEVINKINHFIRELYHE